MSNVTYEMLIGLAILIAIIASVVYAAYRAGSIRGANEQLAVVRADVVSLDQAERSINSAFSAEQLEMFRQIVFPIFALGLAITPQGDPKEAFSRARDLVDILTDRKPNTTPATATTTTTVTTASAGAEHVG
jgi:hypothetical protein